jgi:hypothetical protein
LQQFSQIIAYPLQGIIIRDMTILDAKTDLKYLNASSWGASGIKRDFRVVHE